jgi:hypothetical protein|tara:strand:- start:3587 stop:4357 length:771 start_codon:yes stop_codon:yes gene_type:complete
MADVVKEYTVKVPNEQYVDDWSDNREMTFTYRGPEVCKITIPHPGEGNTIAQPYTQKLDGPVYDNEKTTEVNVTDNPELLPIVDLLYGRPYDLEATFDEETLDDGTVYQVQNNTTIHDWFWQVNCVVDVDTKEFASWELESGGTGKQGDGNPVLLPLLRDPLSPKMRTYIAKADMFVEVVDQFSLPTAEEALLTDYKAKLELYRVKVATPWKFTNQNPFELEAPKIPMELVARHKEITEAGLAALQGSDPNASPVE